MFYVIVKYTQSRYCIVQRLGFHIPPDWVFISLYFLKGKDVAHIGAATIYNCISIERVNVLC